MVGCIFICVCIAIISYCREFFKSSETSFWLSCFLHCLSLLLERKKSCLKLFTVYAIIAKTNKIFCLKAGTILRL